MVYTTTCCAPNTIKPYKLQTFITKAPHEVTLTDTESRVFIKNIKTGVTLDQFKNSLEQYGSVQVYLYEPGTKNDGWAWIGFEDKETAVKLVDEAEKTDEDENNQKHGSVGSNEDKQDSNSFYAENEENQVNEEEEENEDD